MKITHVAEIVNITNVAGILEAEICVAENMRAVLMYNQMKVVGSHLSSPFSQIRVCLVLCMGFLVSD